MSRRIATTMLATGLLLLTWSPLVQAAPVNKQLARLHFAQGKSHFLAGEYTRAIRSFEQAYRHRPHRVILFNIALAHARKGDSVAAATHLRRYLKQAHPTDPKLPPALRQAQRRVGVLSVRVKNPRAQIYIDGRFVGVGSAELVMKPGRSAVVVKLGLKVVARKTVQITAGREHLWELPQEETAAPPASATTPPPRGWRRFQRLHWATFAATAGATLGLFVGAVVASARTKALHADYARDPTNTEVRNRGLRLQRVANALWGLTAVSAVSTAVLAFFTRWRASERPSRFSARPVVGSGQAGFLLRWKY